MDERDPRLGEQMVAASHLLMKNGFGHWFPPYPVSGHVGYALMGDRVTDLRPLTLVRAELTGLSLETCPVTDADVSLIAGFPVLRRLDLTGVPVTDAIAETLTSLLVLQVLSLAGTKVSDAVMAALAARPCLETLDVTATRITDRGVAALAGSPSLRFLKIRQTRTTVAGILALRGCTTLERVTTSLGWRDRRRIRGALPNVDVD